MSTNCAPFAPSNIFIRVQESLDSEVRASTPPPEWYDESPALPSLSRVSPASKKHQHDAFEKELDEITTNNDVISGQGGKTMRKLDAIIAELHHGVQESRLQTRIHQLRMEGIDLRHVYET